MNDNVSYPITWVAGFDCSGTPNFVREAGNHDPYTLCVVAVPHDIVRIKNLQDSLAAVRARFQMSEEQEFRAHGMKEEMQADVLEVILAQQLLVGALLVDKASTRARSQYQDVLPSPSDFQVMAALAALQPMMQRCCIARLYCDEDIQGREKQRELVIALHQCQRLAWPNTRLKVRFLASHRELLVQMADVVAYGLACHARGTLRTIRLAHLVQSIRKAPTTIITGPEAWQ